MTFLTQPLYILEKSNLQMIFSHRTQSELKIFDPFLVSFHHLNPHSFHDQVSCASDRLCFGYTIPLFMNQRFEGCGEILQTDMRKLLLMHNWVISHL